MCRIFSGQDPASYEPITRSVRLAGHATSIRLEAGFWTILDEIAASQGFSTPRFLSVLYDEVLELHGELHNFASLLRVSCMKYLASGRAADARAPTETSAQAAAE